jgi:hypothetical protein
LGVGRDKVDVVPAFAGGSVARVAFLAIALGAAACGRFGFDGRLDAAPDAESGPSLVQGAGNASASASTLSVTFLSPPTLGHVLVLVGAAHISAIQPPTGGTRTWTRAAFSTTNPNMEIWFGVSDGAATTITIQGTAPTGLSLWVGEWAGLATTNVLDTSSAMDGSTSPASAGPITTSSTPDLVIFGANSFLPNTFGVPTNGSWSALDTQIGGSVQTVWFEIATMAGVIEPTVTETKHSWDAAIAAFRISP